MDSFHCNNTGSSKRAISFLPLTQRTPFGILQFIKLVPALTKKAWIRCN